MNCSHVDHVQGTPVRIVSVSSAAHQMDGLDLDDLHFRKRKYSPWKAYGQSKLCNVLYAKELARRYSAGIVAVMHCYCCCGVLLSECLATAIHCYHVHCCCGVLLVACIVAVVYSYRVAFLLYSSSGYVEGVMLRCQIALFSSHSYFHHCIIFKSSNMLQSGCTYKGRHLMVSSGNAHCSQLCLCTGVCAMWTFFAVLHRHM